MDSTDLTPATFGPAGDRWVLKYVVDLPVSRWDAWIAVTTRDGLGTWFPARVLGEWTPGRELVFTFEDDDDPTYGEVVDVDSGAQLAFTWESDSVRLSLEEYDAGTRLTFAASIDSRGRGARDGAGWHGCLAALRESVGGYVEDTDKDPVRLFAMYSERFGPEGSVERPPAPE